MSDQGNGLPEAFDDAARPDPSRPVDVDAIAGEVWRRGRRRRTRGRVAAGAGGALVAASALALGIGVLPGLLQDDPPVTSEQGADVQDPAEDAKRPPSQDAAEAPLPAPEGTVAEPDSDPPGSVPQNEGDGDLPSTGGFGPQDSDVQVVTVDAVGDLDERRLSGLPADLDVPAGSEVTDLPDLPEDPVTTFALAAEVVGADGDAAIVVLGDDGGWRSVPVAQPLEPGDGEPWGALGPAAVDPDGSRLALATPGAVLVVSADGGSRSIPLEGETPRTPVWSADGSSLAVGVGEGPGSLVVPVHSDGETVRGSGIGVGAEWVFRAEWGAQGTDELVLQPVDREQAGSSELGTRLAGTPGAGPVIADEDLVVAAVTLPAAVRDSVLAVPTGEGARGGLLEIGGGGAAVPARVIDGASVVLVHEDGEGQQVLVWDTAAEGPDAVTVAARVDRPSDPATPPLVLAVGSVGVADDGAGE